MNDEIVLWLTYSGRIHKFGPLQPAQSRFSEPYRVALCNRSIAADEYTQSVAVAGDKCKRCFPRAGA